MLTGGAENMSMAPHVLYGARFGVRLGLDLVVSITCIKHHVLYSPLQFYASF